MHDDAKKEERYKNLQGDVPSLHLVVGQVVLSKTWASPWTDLKGLDRYEGLGK